VSKQEIKSKNPERTLKAYLSFGDAPIPSAVRSIGLGGSGKT